MDTPQTYTVKVHKNALKNIEKQQSYIRQNFEAWTKTELTEKPYESNDGMQINESREGLQVYKKRFGDFRAKYIVNDTEVTVLVFEFNSRGSVYKKRT